MTGNMSCSNTRAVTTLRSHQKTHYPFVKSARRPCDEGDTRTERTTLTRGRVDGAHRSCQKQSLFPSELFSFSCVFTRVSAILSSVFCSFFFFFYIICSRRIIVKNTKYAFGIVNVYNTHCTSS